MRVKGKKYGKLKPLTEERKKLIQAYIPLAKKLSNRYKQIVPKWSEQFDSEAFYSLVEAGCSFDSSRNSNFASFACFRICRNLKTKVFKELVKNEVSLDSEENGILLFALSPIDPTEDIEYTDYVQDIIKKLPVCTREIFTLYLIQRKDLPEVSKILCKTLSNTIRLYRLGLVFLKYEIKAQDVENQIC